KEYCSGDPGYFLRKFRDDGSVLSAVVSGFWWCLGDTPSNWTWASITCENSRMMLETGLQFVEQQGK
ncbi:hypothetical protein, partial [uncultured Alteromonas sp.]|uniref:hypothetical protein n=1 Tax=uncultured Alteromonas sp. TaxID=179113 RepID=UPI0025D66ABB